MKIHEYQAYTLFKQYGIPAPEGDGVFSVDEAEAAARKLGEGPYVIKAQIHSGGRGKAGGVKSTDSIEGVRKISRELLGKKLITRQTGAQGKEVHRLFVTNKLSIKREYYVSIMMNGEAGKAILLASQMGGMEIEETAINTPEKIIALPIDPMIGLKNYQARYLALQLGLNQNETKEFIQIAFSLYKLFNEKDCSLIEINPLIINEKDHFMAADAKINFDDNALARHPDIAELEDEQEENIREITASKYGLNYIQLDGNIGCMVNGAGLAMATMDIIQAFGGNPANFLDVGGSATKDRIEGAFSILLSDPNIKGLFINIFGGIMRCDIIAEGVVSAAKKLSVKIPIIVRLEGTNADIGKKVFDESDMNIITANDMADGAKKICELVSRGETFA